MPYSPRPGYLLNQSPSELKAQLEALRVIQAVNEKNAHVKTFTCSEMKIRIMGRSFVRLTGSVYYEKEDRFRMFVRSVVGTELDMGSNEEFFWFWSRRMDPPALYYSRHENLHRTGLRTPFHPVWMKGSLGFGTIPTDGIFGRRRGSNWEFLQLTKNAQGRRVLRSVVVDPKRNLILGQYVYQNGKLVVSSEVYEYTRDGLPKRMLIRWYEEDVTMILEFINPKINQSITPDAWKKPLMRLEVEMGN